MKITKNTGKAFAYMSLMAFTREYNNLTDLLMYGEIEDEEGATKKEMLFEMIEHIQDAFDIDLDTDYEDGDEDYDYLSFPDYEQEEFEKLMKEQWA